MVLTIALIAATAVFSYRGIKDAGFMQQYSFSIHSIRERREYVRFISSGFLHISWLHLAINMFVLFAFGSGLEVKLGVIPFLVIYLTSMVGGNLLALLIHQHNHRYSSVGASGAVSGLIFASIALFPTMNIFFLPGWVFGIIYVLYTIYAIRSQRTDVGHAAHLGGALIGMAFALLMFPQVLAVNLLPILGILLPGILLILIMIYKPELIMIDKKTQRKFLTQEDKYNLSKAEQKKEIDRILEKINQKGIDSLSRKERKLLDDYSRTS